MHICIGVSSEPKMNCLRSACNLKELSKLILLMMKTLYCGIVCICDLRIYQSNPSYNFAYEPIRFWVQLNVLCACGLL